MIISKSYQNCTETEVPGYNDCPSFLFLPHKPAARRKQRVVSQPLDTATAVQTHTDTSAPPIARHRKLHVESQAIKLLNKEEILHRVDELYALTSSLLSNEFEFYKSKVDKNLVVSLDNVSTRQVMTRFFNEAHDKPKASNTLRAWMSSDVSVINWCPAFLKIFEHSQCA